VIPNRPMFRGCCAVTMLVALIVAPVRAEVVNRIVATVDGEPITAHELERFKEERNADPNLSDSAILEALVTEKLLQREAIALGIQATDADVDAYVAEVKQKNHLDDERFKQALAREGLTLEQYRERVKTEIQRTQLVNREIRGRVNVSPAEVKRYYDAHLDDYAVSERVTVRDIFFPVDRDANQDEVDHVRAKADEVRAMLVAGKDFEKLAKQFSEGPGADKGGLLGTVSLDELDPELAKAIRGLEKGKVSDPVRTEKGFHLLRVDERTSAGHKKVEEVSDSIKESLYNENLEKRFQEWLTHDLRERHHVEVLD